MSAKPNLGNMPPLTDSAGCQMIVVIGPDSEMLVGIVQPINHLAEHR